MIVSVYRHAGILGCIVPIILHDALHCCPAYTHDGVNVPDVFRDCQIIHVHHRSHCSNLPSIPSPHLLIVVDCIVHDDVQISHLELPEGNVVVVSKKLPIVPGLPISHCSILLLIPSPHLPTDGGVTHRLITAGSDICGLMILLISV
jgi:hypothetical protein